MQISPYRNQAPPTWPVAVLEVLATLLSVAFYFLSLAWLMPTDYDLLWWIIFLSAFPFIWFVGGRNITVRKTLEGCVYAVLAVGFTAPLWISPPAHYEHASWGRIIQSILIMAIMTAVQAIVTTIVQTVLDRASDSHNSGDR
jgi:hypothetical protein